MFFLRKLHKRTVTTLIMEKTISVYAVPLRPGKEPGSPESRSQQINCRTICINRKSNLYSIRQRRTSKHFEEKENFQTIGLQSRERLETTSRRLDRPSLHRLYFPNRPTIRVGQILSTIKILRLTQVAV